MALFQTQTAKIGKVETLLSGTNAGIIIKDFVVPTGALVNDVVEFGAIPHMARVVDVEVFQDGVGVGCTADIGLISGDYGGDLQSRTCGSEFYGALPIATAGKAIQTTRNLMAVEPRNSAVGFGLRFTGAAPTSGRKITIALTLASA